MPFVDDEVSSDLTRRADLPKGFAVTPGAEEFEKDQPDRPMWNWAAAFRVNNEVSAWGASNSAWETNAEEPGFNPWDKIKGTPLEPQWDKFVNVRNERMFDAVRRDIDRETEDRKTLAAQPWWMSLATEGAAGVLSPTVFLPGGAFVRGAKGGLTIARSALSVGAGAAAGTAVQEAALQGVEQTRTAFETSTAIGGSMLLGGLIGAGGSALMSRGEWQRAVNGLNRELGGEAHADPAFEPGDLQATFGAASVGAAAAGPASIDALTIAGRAAGALAGATEQLNPALRLSQSPSAVTREVGSQLFENSLYLKQNMEGLTQGAAAETLMKEWNGGLIQALSSTDEAYKAARKGGFTGSDLEFREEVGRAMRRGDTHANPEVDRVAKSWRTNVFEPLKEAAIKAGLLPPDVSVDTAQSYFSRMWNRQRLIRQEGEFKNRVMQWVQTESPRWADQYDRGVERRLDPLRREIDDLEMQKLRRGEELKERHGPERIRAAAVRFEDQIFEGVNHGEAYENAVNKLGRDPFSAKSGSDGANLAERKNLNGFVTTTGRFVDRREAAELADAASQTAGRKDKLAAHDITGTGSRFVDTSEMSESDIRRALQIVQGGAPRPKGVKTLSQFVVEAGGLVDYATELASRGITNRVRPGMVRKTRRTAQNDGGWDLDDMALHAWENGYFPNHNSRPSADEFVDALNDDFHKIRPVLKRGEEDAFALNDHVNQLEADLSRAGVLTDGKAPRFATSDELKGAVERVFKAMDLEADRKITLLKDRLKERETDASAERDSRFVGDPRELGKQIADEVFDALTGKNADGLRPEFIKITARGPLKERTFNIPDELVEDFLEHDVAMVGRRYTRVMGADVEIKNKFGDVNLIDQLQRVRDNYLQMRSGVTDEKTLAKLTADEERDMTDLKAVRDLLRGTYDEANNQGWWPGFVRGANAFNYIRSMGEVVLASLTDAVRPAMVHGLRQYMSDLPQFVANAKAVRLSIKEAQLAGNVAERVLMHRMGTLTEIIDPYSGRGPMEAFLAKMTDRASKWNGIRHWTDGMKSIASVMTQNRILNGAEKYGQIGKSEKAYLAFLGVDESMAGRIAKQFAEHGDNLDGVRVANTEDWTDAVARRAYRAAMNKDVDSIIVQKSVADVPLFAHTPTGRMMLQFKTFALASHQRVLLRGLQEDQSRFIGGMISLTMMGMFMVWMKALSGNRTEKLEEFTKNPGWWIAEGLDRSGILAVPMELANTFEKASAFAGAKFNPIKAPLTAFDEGSAISQKNQNKNVAGAILGPTYGLGEDILTGLAPGAVNLATGETVTAAQKNASERVLPFNSYLGFRQTLRYLFPPEER